MRLTSRSLLGPSALAVSLLVLQWPGEAASPPSRVAARHRLPGRLLVKLRIGATEQGAEALFRARGAATARHFRRPRKLTASAIERWWRVGLAASADPREAMRQLSQNPLVERVEVDSPVSIAAVPNDPAFAQLWGLNNTGQTGGTADADVDAPEAWDVQSSSPGVVVAVIDTGVDYDHPDLAANIWTNPGEIPGNDIDDDGNGFVDDVHGYDFYHRDGDPMDDHGHGTHVSGTIAAVGDNGIGVAGVSWHARIMAVKFLGPDGSGSTSDAVDAVLYATEMGAKVSNNSWGGAGYSQALRDAIAAADAAGSLFVAAAGNSASDNDVAPSYPAAFDVPNVLTVAATDHGDALAGFSSYGATTVHLGAPGVNVYSTVPVTGSACCSDASGYKSLNGTSMATPHVTGAAALLFARFPGLSVSQARQRLMYGGDPVSALAGRTVSGRRLNLPGMLEEDAIPPDDPVNFAATGHSAHHVSLSWTSTADDGSAGAPVSMLDLRYSTAPISPANFAAAPRVPLSVAPVAPGATQNVTVSGLASDTQYYFALRLGDNVGNLSGLATASERTGREVTVFQDDFEHNPDHWTFSGSDGTGLGTLWHLSAHRPHSPIGALYYGRENYWNYDTGAANFGTADSDLIDLTGRTASWLSFYHVLQKESSTIFDSATVLVSDNGGATWTPVRSFGASTPLQMELVGIDLSAYDGRMVRIRFAFDTRDALFNDYDGWTIDDVTVSAGVIGNPPVADAGPDQAREAGATLWLDGSASYDPDGDLLTYVWTGPNGFVGNGPFVPATAPPVTAAFTLRVTDTSGNSATDQMTVNVVDLTPPIVHLTAPLPGETIPAGIPYVVRWTASDNGVLVSFDVLYSIDGGMTYSAVPGCAGLLAGTRSCTWASPGPPTSQGSVRVVGHDGSGNAGTDTSPIVVFPPFVHVDAPNVPTVWPIGSVQTIAWTHTLPPGSTVDIDVGRDGIWTPIAAGVPNAGSYSWLVTGPSVTTARVRVGWSASMFVNDASDVDFTIGAPAFRVKDIMPGPTGSSPRSLVNLYGTTIFAANDQVTGMEPWRSDGAAAGTVLLKDILPGPSSSNPAVGTTFARVGRTVYFAATDPTFGTELWKTEGTPAVTVMVKDIWPGTSSSAPGSMVAVNGTLFFTATTSANGQELWKSDGTSAGTVMVRDLRLGTASSAPFALTDVDGTLYFAANDGTTGTELWKSDGTSLGTVLVRDIVAGSASSNPGNMLNVGGTLFFSAAIGASGQQLWRTNGTPTGTLVLTAGTGGSQPQLLTNLNGIVYFAFADPVKGTELWRSDGTPSGTFMLKDINPTGSSSPASLVVDRATLFFSALEPAAGRELWKTDGTPVGTVLVKDIAPGPSSSSPTSLVAGDGVLLFQATDVRGAELWESDGTAAGTVITQDIFAGPGSSAPAELTVGGHRLTFVASDSAGGRELWALPRVVNLPPVVRAGPDRIVPVGSFTLDGSQSWDPDDDPLTYQWKDEAGNVVGGSAVIAVTRPVGTYAYTLAVGDGYGLPVSDSVTVTVDGYPVADAGPDKTAETGTPVTLDGSASFDPDGDPLTFAWRTSGGTLLGTTPSITVNLPTGANTVTLTVADNRGGAGSDNVLVTMTDTTAPSVAVTAPADGAELYTGVPLTVQWTASDNGAFAAFDVSFSADGGATFTPASGCTALAGAARSCVWSSPGPGTSNGRVRVMGRDTGGNSGADDSVVTMITTVLQVDEPNTAVTWPIGTTQTIAWTHNLGASATFKVEVSANGGATWNLLGSAAPSIGPDAGRLDWVVTRPNSGNARVRVSWAANPGTSDVSDADFTIGVPAYRVRNLNGAASSVPGLLTNAGGTVFFTAIEVGTGTELWKSDGTDAGTVLVKDITAGPVSTNISSLTAVGDKVFFKTLSNSLWKSDGTAAGTAFVGSLPEPGGPSSMSSLTAFAGKLYFVGCEFGFGCELWSSGGSGVERVKDINPGSATSSPAGLTVFNGKLYFSASDGVNGLELWASDGTAAGTVLVKDINPGTPSSNPTVFQEAGGTLFFSATSQYQGRELFKTDGTAAGTVMVANSTVSYASTFIEAAARSGNLLFYRAYEENACCIFNKELWRSDGTEAGTFRTKDIVPGDSGSNPDWLTDLGGKLYFTANDGTGVQLWRSDGSNAGTVPFKTVAPAVGTSPAQLRSVDGMLFFSAQDASGYELWQTDGTAAGTALIQDVNPGSISANPANLITARHRLFFTATSNGETELWALPANVNELPVANAGVDRTIEAGAPVTLTGTASDADRDALTYEWKDENGAVIGTAAAVTVSPSVGGHTFTFKVSDDHGGSASDTVVVTVQDTTSPLVHVTTPRSVTVPTAAPLTIEWTASDNDALVGFDVTFSSDGGVTYAPIAECTALPGTARSCGWPAAGPRTAAARVRITARDGTGNAAVDESPFVINRAPVAAAAATPPPAIRNQAVSFDGTASSDPDGDSLTYQWDFGDGATGTGVSPSHAYAAVGPYSVTLVVDDGIVVSDPVIVSVTVANQVPVASAGGPYTGVRNQAITLTGAGSTDADGDALTYQWDFGDGATATGANPTYAFTTLGAHTVTLVVNDGTDSSSPATTTVTISNQAPTASAGGPYTGVRNQAIVFTGAGSSDVDGDTLTYQWNFGDGATATGVSPTHSFTTLGAHTVTLVVNDGTDSSAPATTTVTISNQVPVASAGGPYTGVRNQAITFTGAGSTDADGDALTYQWDFGDGATATGANPTHAFTTLGAHTVTLVVNDGTDSSSPATATVTISNQVPVASAGGPYTGVRNQAITFTGAGSTDADGDALTYQWDFGDGATATGANPTYAFTTLGAHTVTLVVNDGTDSSSPATASVTISNEVPEASAGGPYTGVRNQAIVFTGAGSSDADGDTLTYQWNFGDGATATGVSPTHSFTTLGAHTVTLVVNDGTDSSAPATTTVTISNQVPVASAGGPYTGVRNQAITFTAAGSTDADGDTLTYQWNFGDGATATGVSPAHAYVAVGNYVATLVVRDGNDDSAPVTAIVTISNQAPIAKAGTDQTVELGNSVTLNGAASSDPDQDPLTYEWRDGGGAVVGTSAAVTLDLPLGTYTFTLTVHDGQGGTASDPVNVLVRDLTPPVVTVTAPQAVALLTGVATLVEWTAADNGALAGFDVAFSTDGGTTYVPVPGCSGLGGAARSCTWTSPGPATAQGRLRVAGRDASNNASAATSAFTIVAPALTVTAPSTAVSWGLGSTQAVTWTSNLGSSATVRIELSRNGGSTWTSLAASAPNTGSFAWTVSGATTTTARIRVTWTSGPGVSDTSDANFTIAAAGVTVTAPNTRVTWTVGSVRTITWSHNLGTSATMRIEVSRNGGSTWSVIAASAPNSAVATGSFSWTVTGPASTQARIRVSWSTNTAVNDRSNVNFVIQ